MRLINAEELKKQITAMAIANNYPVDKVNKMCKLIDCQPTVYDVDKVIQKEGLKEQGELLKLPCAVGDMVYDVVFCSDEKYRIFEMKVCHINPFGDVRKGKIWNVYLEDGCTKAYRSFYNFGKTVFLTRKEAEAKLAAVNMELESLYEAAEDCGDGWMYCGDGCGGGWIYCGDGKNMPEEHDSIFAKLKGTDKWSDVMFEKSSADVNVTIEFEDGKRTTKTLHTIDGEWNGGQRGVKFKVVAWQPLPEPYRS